MAEGEELRRVEVVDARDLACPQPVVLTRRAMQKGRPLTTIVDNEVAVANVSRMARSAGWEAEVDTRPDGTYTIYLRPPGEAVEAGPTSPQPQPSAAVSPVVVFLASETIGSGDETLGGVLMRAFLHTLQELERLPDVVVCMNGGVRLSVHGSPVLEDLKALVDCGTEVLICGTCLDFFGLKEQVAVGTVSNMYTIAETLLGAGRVVRV